MLKSDGPNCHPNPRKPCSNRGVVSFACAALLAVAITMPFSGAAAPGAAEYGRGAASSDGIGRFYHGREIARVMGFEGASWLDRPEREREERPDRLVEELRIEPGMTIADVGAGSGYLSRRLAPLVAPGKVYAVDVQPQMIDLLKDLAREPGMGNIVPWQDAVDDTKLPAASLDLAVMVDVYHELAYPAEVVESLVRALKPGGRLVFVEYRAEDPAVPIKALHKMTAAQVRLEMRDFPLRFERDSESLPLQHLIVFRKN